jgi:transporter family-2 protein
LSLLGGVLAFIAGAIMAVQGSINSGLGKLIGVLRATFVVHLAGTLFALVLVVLPFLKEKRGAAYTDIPWYLYMGGVLGVAIVYLVAVSIPRLGVAVATTLIIVGQVGTALAIDQLGLFGLQRVPFSWFKGVGLLLLAAGAGLLLKK